MRSRPVVGAVLAFVALLAASEPAAAAISDGFEPSDPPVVTITTRDYEFSMPDRIPAGVVTLRLVNEGKEPHHVTVARLKDGKTMADFGMAMEAAMSPDASGPVFPSWIDFLGGPQPPPPGGQSETTVVLRPGTYVFLCVIPSPDGQPHMAKGMVKTVTAVEAEGGAELPAADIAVMLTNYDFKLSKELKPGRQTLRVRNYASQPHELVLVKLNEGRSGEEFIHWAEAPQGPPPGMMLGGAGVLSGNTANNVTVDLTAGRYALICFLPDEKDRKPHFVHGMVKEVTVSD